MKPTKAPQLQTGEISSDQALEWFQQADLIVIPPYFLTHWKTKKHFFYFEGALLAFEKTRRQYIITGEPAKTSRDDDEKLYQAFISFAHKRKKKVCGFYVGKSWQSAAFAKRPIGTSFRLKLDDYDFGASKAKEVRRSLRKGAASDYTIVKSEEIDQDKLSQLLKTWKKKKLPLKLKFFLSEPKANSTTSSFEKWYVVSKNNQYFSFCSTVPYKNGARTGLYLDHLIYDPFQEKSALSYLVSSLIHNAKNDGVDEINLGLNPFANITSNGFTEKIFKSLYKMPFLYRPKGLHYFKGKFAGQEETEFFFHEKKNSPILSLFGMMQTTLKK